MKHRDISLSNDEKDVCNVSGCNNSPKRSIPRKRVEKADALSLQGSNRKVHLCSDCYRIFKKETKKDRAMESLGR
ncbi:MAG TPA: hypothetical protein QGI59_03925 [Candidatus Poseidoniia archaeon]|jgi:hypothetical protein|nr:hypothetical protein [Candidatus Poseidoniia archaeon]